MKLVGKDLKGGYTVYRLSLESVEEQESDTVLIYHFTEWPQHAVPNNGTKAVCDMYHDVLNSKSNQVSVCMMEANLNYQ